MQDQVIVYAGRDKEKVMEFVIKDIYDALITDAEEYFETYPNTDPTKYVVTVSIEET